MNAEVVAPLVEGWQRGDFRPRGELLADDLLLTGFTAGGDDVARGEEEVAAYLRQFFAEWRNYRITVDRVRELDERHVFVEGRQHGTGRASGIDIDETVFIVIAVDAGKVTGIHWHARRDGALRAAGVAS